jgi:maleylacetoacetate isomerase
MKLYSYYRSSASYRVRIALNLKQLEYELVEVNLLESEESSNEYQQINPQQLVPVLEHQGQRYFQSMSILEFLEEAYPEQPILPDNNHDRAQVRALANIVACDIHPLNNLRVLNYLTGELGHSEEEKLSWYRHWIELSFAALETHLQATSSGLFCFGDSVTLADILLIPQVYNARRFAVDLASFPLIRGINEHCLTLDAFHRASPEMQPIATSAADNN